MVYQNNTSSFFFYKKLSIFFVYAPNISAKVSKDPDIQLVFVQYAIFSNAY